MNIDKKLVLDALDDAISTKQYPAVCANCAYYTLKAGGDYADASMAAMNAACSTRVAASVEQLSIATLAGLRRYIKEQV